MLPIGSLVRSLRVKFFPKLVCTCTPASWLYFMFPQVSLALALWDVPPTSSAAGFCPAYFFHSSKQKNTYPHNINEIPFFLTCQAIYMNKYKAMNTYRRKPVYRSNLLV